MRKIGAVLVVLGVPISFGGFLYFGVHHSGWMDDHCFLVWPVAILWWVYACGAGGLAQHIDKDGEWSDNDAV